MSVVKRGTVFSMRGGAARVLRRGAGGRILFARAILIVCACVPASSCDVTFFPLDPTGEEGGGEFLPPAEPPADDVHPTPAHSDQAAPILSFQARRAFCCNPLRVQFEINPFSAVALNPSGLEWDFGDGKTGYGSPVEHVYTWPGTYLVVASTQVRGKVISARERLIVGEVIEIVTQSDEEGVTGPAIREPVRGSDGDTDSDKSAAEGGRPVAWAGEDQRVLVGSIVTLDGSQSISRGGEALRFTWRQISGLPVILEHADRSAARFTAPEDVEEATSLVFELAIADSHGANRDLVVVTVEPDPDAEVEDDSPVHVFAGPDLEVVSGEHVTLAGSVPDEITREAGLIQWRQVAGPPVGTLVHTDLTATFFAPTTREKPVVLEFEFSASVGARHGADRVTVVVVRAPPMERSRALIELQKLPPLPKVHYCWPVSTAMLLDRDPLLFEYVRITRALGIRGWNRTPEEIEAAVALCDEVTRASSGPPATIAVNYSPWHILWPPELPPTDRGPHHEAEIEKYRSSLSDIHSWIAEANAKFHSAVEVSALLLDTERFLIKEESEPGFAEWNAAMDEKYNAFYTIGKEWFPAARVEWYMRGTAWWRFTGNELADGDSVALYELPKMAVTRSKYRGAYNRAVQRGIDEVMPWVALGAGYKRAEGEEPWTFDWNYDPEISRQFGAELNDPYYADRPDEFAPWHGVKRVTFYPAPFYEKVPYWAEHFIAYIRGAHGLEPLP